MFNFFKNLLKKEKKEIKIEELEGWVKTKKRSVKSDLEHYIKEKLEEMQSILSDLDSDLKSLEDAGIKDAEKVMPKIKNAVLSHRKNYIRLVRQLVESIDIPEPDYSKALKFCDHLEKELDIFGKKSTKSYFTSQHLFSEQVEKIASDLKSLSQNVREIKQSVKQSSIRSIEKIEKEIAWLKDSGIKKEDIGCNIDKIRQDISKLKKASADLEQKKESLEKSQDLLRLKKDTQNLSEIEEKISSVKEKIADIFLPLQAGLKKYQRIALSGEDIIAGYVKDPRKALLYDKELAVLDILNKMKSSIGSLRLKERKKNKTLEQIEKIDKDILKNIVQKLDMLNRKKEQLDKNIKKNTALSKISSVDESIRQNKADISDLKDRICSLEKSKKELDTQNIREEIKETARDKFDLEIIFS